MPFKLHYLFRARKLAYVFPRHAIFCAICVVLGSGNLMVYTYEISMICLLHSILLHLGVIFHRIFFLILLFIKNRSLLRKCLPHM